jgi:hypothetical protein
MNPEFQSILTDAIHNLETTANWADLAVKRAKWAVEAATTDVEREAANTVLTAAKAAASATSDAASTAMTRHPVIGMPRL